MSKYEAVVKALQERAKDADHKTGALLKAAANVIRDMEQRVFAAAQSRPDPARL